MRMLAVSVLVLSMTTLAWAQEGRDPQPDRPKPKERQRAEKQEERGRPPQTPNPERLFKALDTNADGKIERGEFDRRLPEVLGRWREAQRGERERPEGPPAVMRESPERMAGKDVREAMERKGPEMAEHIKGLVERNMRELMERQMPEMKRRIEELVDRKVREALAEREGERREKPGMALPALPPRGKAARGFGGGRAFVPDRERGGRPEIPGFGPPVGPYGRGERFREMRPPWGLDDRCPCPQSQQARGRMKRSWGPPCDGWGCRMERSRDGWRGGRWERPVPSPRSWDGPRQRHWRDAPW